MNRLGIPELRLRLAGTAFLFFAAGMSILILTQWLDGTLPFLVGLLSVLVGIVLYFIARTREADRES